MKLPQVTESILYGTKPLITGEAIKWRGSKAEYAAFNTAAHELESSISAYNRLVKTPTADLTPSAARAHLDAVSDAYHALCREAEACLTIRHQLIQHALENSAEYSSSNEDAEVEKIVAHFAKVSFDSSSLPIYHRDIASAERQFAYMVRCVPSVKHAMMQTAARRAKLTHLRKDVGTTATHLANCSASAISIASQ